MISGLLRQIATVLGAVRSARPRRHGAAPAPVAVSPAVTPGPGSCAEVSIGR